VGSKEATHVAGEVQGSGDRAEEGTVRKARASKVKGDTMLESIPPDVHDIYKRVLIMLAVIVALISARKLFPEFFQCHSPECQRTHLGEP
jgi:hypothetical protein